MMGVLNGYTRYYILLIAIFFCACDSSSFENNEVDKRSIQKVFESYGKEFQKKNWDGLLNHIYPEAFKFLPRMDFRKALDTTFAGDGYEMLIRKHTVDSISKTLNDGKLKYAMVFAHVDATMQLDKMGEYDEETFDEVCESMKQEMGRETTTCDWENRKFDFVIDDTAWAIFTSKNNRWYVLSNTAEGKVYVNKIVPSRIRKRFN